ncbi:PhoX family phosphatase [Gilvimarinus sp. SDUM040013]|uniref:PhoX family phosphatase n=1 Tax=Gilvimarinus gilvus TaxID=3058038 RepID=A0ABU4RVR8_9GAMM|nr:PhoX family phosphatase [Gilvimarinus sp. SDUM040013]MDO3387278.1 PhoX family phosphatase [Gilvimarinus sp. SDUM040013]MDX6848967.1 PhoX family phosphatase [Gilvimarinus sp. SDUM040013]
MTNPLNKNSLQKDYGFGDVDDLAVNPSAAAATAESNLEQLSFSRRSVLTGSMASCLALGAGPFSLSACSSHTSQISTDTFADTIRPDIGFQSVPVALGDQVDTVTVPPGYTARAFFSWGDTVTNAAPGWTDSADATADVQTQQAGQNHDGMHFFPFSNEPNAHGLLVVNHEYTNDTLHPNGPTVITGKHGEKIRPLAQVQKEQAAHGASIIEVKKDSAGHWQRVLPSAFNRRLTVNTPMEIRGPAAGSDAMKTAQDPTGTRVLGTLNNCSMGVTPWGTYLMCEENWKNYFVNRDHDDWQQRSSHHRYAIAQGPHSHKYYWESVDPRFDATPNDALPYQGFVNEPNRFGWVVEFDPFDPQSTPIKRTALGRLVREGCTCVLADDGTMAFYSGDDTRGEYVYKFVPSARFDAARPERNKHLLDKGTVYCASYNADGTGQWRALEYGQNGLTEVNGFHSQADVLIDLRRAADTVGATSMDRPEWVAVHPQTTDGYISLTNNYKRGVVEDQPLNPANPRAENHHGQILRWREHEQNPAALSFEWELFVLAGPVLSTIGDNGEPQPLSGDRFSCPDGLWFDGDNRLWIATDYDELELEYNGQGCNQLLCADTVTRVVKRFATGPIGAEITGLTGTPDGKALWFNVQHPAISYPASDGKTRPRSTTVLVTKDDGGVIGT